MRRAFNSRERFALYSAADGKCTLCGTELEAGWHADHVNPYSRGGPTDVINGAALCPPCNQQKGNKIMTDRRTQWQEEGVAKFLQSNEDFLITACPGAGKTRLGLMAARRGFDEGLFDRVYVIVPRKALQKQWAAEAENYGFYLLNDLNNANHDIPKDAHGAVGTYAQVSSWKEKWRHWTSRQRTLVIFDEIHHCADDESSSWGAAIKQAFEPAIRRLALSGTPFRTDTKFIPFVKYVLTKDEKEKWAAESNYSLSYRDALAVGICQDVRFWMMDGEGRWHNVGEKSAHTSTVSDTDQSALMTTLYDPTLTWVPSLMREADKELTRIRDEMPNAGGLIIASSVSLAKEYAKLMSGICGEPVNYVVHDDLFSPDPYESIKQFRQGTQRWIVAVDMITEGVDIPRIRVEVLASRKKTEMWFRQMVGRAVRINEVNVTSTIFIPELKEYVALASKIMDEEVSAGLSERLEDTQRIVADQQQELPFDPITPLASSSASLGLLIKGGDHLGADAIAQAKALVAAIPELGRLSLETQFQVCSYYATSAVAVNVPQTSVVEVSQNELRQQWRTAVNRKVASKAKSPDDFPKIHGKLNAMFDERYLSEASIATLKARMDVLDRWS